MKHGMFADWASIPLECQDAAHYAFLRGALFGLVLVLVVVAIWVGKKS